jgi:NADH-quinone oxidoreductase subunit D
MGGVAGRAGCEDGPVVRELLAGVGPGALAEADVVLDLGPQHPTTHGGLQLALLLEDGDTGPVVVRAEPVVGFQHRGAEKLYEVRDYRQALVLADRHDWVSPFTSEVGLALAVERALGLDLPPRAAYLRTALAELQRVAASLLFLGGLRLDGDPDAVHGLAEREAVLRVLEEHTGGRVHPMANAVGGLKQDVPQGWPQRVREVVDVVRRGLPTLRALVDAADHLRGVGVLDPATALARGATGPVARASGVDVDLRRDDPYLAYGALGVEVVLGSAGDAWSRTDVLLRQVAVSLDLVQAALADLPGGPVSVRLPKTVRAPEGATYAWTESTSGVSGWYLVSRGAVTPWRLAMRTASSAHASLLPALLPGTQLRDVAAVLGTLFLVVGDIDK